MINTRPIVVLAILFASLIVSLPVFAESTQSSYTVNLTYLTVQLSYPSQVSPGDTATLNIQANTKSGSSPSSVSLTAQVYYANGAELRQLTTATLSKEAYSGNNLTKQVQFSIPQDAPRTSLMAVLTEKVQTLYVIYYYYPHGYNYSSHSPNYCYYYSSWSPDCYYANYGYASGYPEYSYDTTTDSGVAPLSYILAKTPEYISVQTQYQSLQSQYQALQQQLTQSQAQNQQLNTNLENAQSTIAQRDASIASMNQQLKAMQGNLTTLEIVAAALAVVAIVFGVLPLRKRNSQPNPTAATQTK